jgi:hypothetical protein
MTRDELLAALTAERYDNRWWTTPEPRRDPDTESVPIEWGDDDLIRARRKRDLLAAVDHTNTKQEESA